MRKPLILIIALLIVLSIAGAGGYFYFYKAPSSKQTAKLNFVSVKPMVVSLQPAKGNAFASGSTYLQVGFELSTTDLQAVQEFKAMRPAVRGNILDLLLKQPQSVISNDGQREKMKTAVLGAVNSTIAGSHDSKNEHMFSKIYVTRFVTQGG